jgi:SAM-dependent methyltransferase
MSDSETQRRPRVLPRRRLREYDYLTLSSLEPALEQQIARRLAGRTGLRILDLGCGQRPYEAIFRQLGAGYLAYDVPSQQADVAGTAGSLPFSEQVFDAVLCTQVLEHVPDPAATLAEISRVLKPGGWCFLSTHGTYLFHPHPTDYWRWTQQGMERIFWNAGTFGAVELFPNRGTGACLASLAAALVHLWSRGRSLRPLRRLIRAALVPVVNIAGLLLDGLLRSFAYPHRYSLIANFLVVAQRRPPGI